MPNTKNIQSFRDFAEYILNLGGYKYIFCSDVQFASRWRYSTARTEDKEDVVGRTEVSGAKQAPIVLQS